MEKESQNKNSHAGHRNKVRKRYFETGISAMAEHNVLELLLFYGVPLKDTNQVAHDLLEKFGSFNNVLEADEKELLQVKKMTNDASCLIKMILPLKERYLKNLENYTIDEEEKCIRYLSYLGQELDASKPQMFVICFNSSGACVGKIKFADTDFTDETLRYNDFLSFILKTNASSAVIVHTHPNGLAIASKADISATESISKLLKNIKVNLLDHIIVSERSNLSLASCVKFMHLFKV